MRKIEDLHKIAKALLIYETLSGDEIRGFNITKISILQDHSKKRKTMMERSSSALGSIRT